MPRLLAVVALLLLLPACRTTEAERQRQIRDLFTRAAGEEGRREYEAARKSYSDVIELNPQHSRAYFKRGTAYAREQKYKEALEDLDRAIELHKLYASAFYNRGEIRRAMWNADQSAEQYLIAAMDDYRRAIDIDRNHPQAHKKLAFLLALWPEVKHKHLAIHHYRRHLKIVRADAQAERWLEKLLRSYGDPRELEKKEKEKQKAGKN